MRTLALICAAWAMTGAALAQSAAPYDIVITGGRIVDGTGSPWYSGDVGIRAGKVAAIGQLGEAARTRTIDARGMVVAPGFIDDLPGHHY